MISREASQMALDLGPLMKLNIVFWHSYFGS